MGSSLGRWWRHAGTRCRVVVVCVGLWPLSSFLVCFALFRYANLAWGFASRYFAGLRLFCLCLVVWLPPLQIARLFCSAAPFYGAIVYFICELCYKGPSHWASSATPEEKMGFIVRSLTDGPRSALSFLPNDVCDHHLSEAGSRCWEMVTDGKKTYL
jgi:hypothetical protein